MAVALLLAFAAPAMAVVFSGEVEVGGAQPVYTPPSMSSPVVLRAYLADGTRVHKGEVVLRIDASDAESQLRKLHEQIVQTGAQNAKEVAELELKRIDAELALADARADRDAAAVDAAIPKTLISALNYDRYQSEMRRTERALATARESAAQAAGAVARRRQDGALALEKLRSSLGFYEDRVRSAAVRADTDGTLVHGFDENAGGGRFEEGSTSWPGTLVGQVIGPSTGYRVTGWVLEPDRAGLRVGQPVALAVDALPGRRFGGTIDAIGGAPMEKAGWGDGRYYRVGIRFGEEALPHLLAGMSVRIDTGTSARPAAKRPPATGGLTLEGEVFAARTVAIAPPEVEGLYQMTIARMADDGAHVAKGEEVVAFDAGQVGKNLTGKRAELAEKRRKQEQTRLDLADRKREAELATAQARAEAEKARRKADLPQDYVAAVQYRKLVIARRKAERKLELTALRERVAADERAAEQHMADGEVKQLREEVAQLQRSLAALSVKAPREGVFLHFSSWNGMVDTGSQVWRGSSVGQIPDMHSLAVRAALPERELDRVHPGQRVLVRAAGGGQRALSGRVTRLGNSVHSKSRVEPVPVVDVEIALEQSGGFKPGQAVEVLVPARKEKP